MFIKFCGRHPGSLRGYGKLSYANSACSMRISRHLERKEVGGARNARGVARVMSHFSRSSGSTFACALSKTIIITV